MRCALLASSPGKRTEPGGIVKTLGLVVNAPTAYAY